MTQEEKQLLLKDLCARLLYGVKIYSDIGGDNTLLGIYGDRVFTTCEEPDKHNDYPAECIKPYLRPMSSMTESEIDKLFDILHIDKDGNDDDWIKINDVVGIKFFFPTGKWVEDVAEAYDYLNSIHIDYRGFINKGLALEAPDNMYKQ